MDPDDDLCGTPSFQAFINESHSFIVKVKFKYCFEKSRSLQIKSFSGVAKKFGALRENTAAVNFLVVS